MRAPEHFETARLVARPPRPSDATAAFACYAADPVVTRFLAWKPHADVPPVAEFFAACGRQWAESSGHEGHFAWLLFRRDDHELVGSIGVDLVDHTACFGYVLGRAHWGQGLAAEALAWLVDWALAQESLYRAWAVCDVENPASARVLEKAGMLREGILHRWHVCPTLGPEPRDCLVYAKTR